jgi:hypothetical protein
VNTDDPEPRLCQAERRVLKIQAKLHRWARENNHTTPRDLRRARCIERCSPGSGSGPGKRAGREAGTAPRADFTGEGGMVRRDGGRAAR